VPLTHELKCRAAALVLPPGAAITGRSAATLRGVSLAKPGDPVEVSAPMGLLVQRRKELHVRQSAQDMGTVSTTCGVPVTDPLHTAFDLVGRHPLPLAVAHLDAFARAGHVQPSALQEWLSHRRDRGVRAAREAAALMDLRSESIPESRTRVLLVKAGFDVTPQHEIRSEGRFVARVDLALVELRIAIEYDGAWHALREQLSRDRTRLNALTRAGWIVVHVTAAMLADPQQVIAAVRAAVLQRR
jgi:very-short-patch-repair endonuclease